MNIRSTLKAGVIALALTGTAFAVAPAQAASPTFGFQLNLGGTGFGPGFHTSGPRGGIVLQFGDRDYFDYCLTNRQITSGLRSNGYSNVKIVRESNNTNKVWAIGKKRGDWYQMRIDRCTHKVDQIKEIYPVEKGGNSFNLTFRF